MQAQTNGQHRLLTKAPANARVKDPDNGAEYRFRLDSGRAVLFGSDAGRSLLAVCRPNEVRVDAVRGEGSE